MKLPVVFAHLDSSLVYGMLLALAVVALGYGAGIAAMLCGLRKDRTRRSRAGTTLAVVGIIVGAACGVGALVDPDSGSGSSIFLVLPLPLSLVGLVLSSPRLPKQ